MNKIAEQALKRSTYIVLRSALQFHTVQLIKCMHLFIFNQN